jgi:hypothetical protein
MTTNKLINLNNIFSLFSPDGEIGKNNDKVFIDLTQNPIYWIGMYKKIILNYVISRRKHVKFFQSIAPNIDSYEIEETGDFIILNRAYSYIQNINLSNEFHTELLISNGDDDFEFSLQLGIKYFEKLEEFEKCYHLKEILTLIEKKFGIEENP